MNGPKLTLQLLQVRLNDELVGIRNEFGEMVGAVHIDTFARMTDDGGELFQVLRTGEEVEVEVRIVDSSL
jgi:hypothetical protein